MVQKKIWYSKMVFTCISLSSLLFSVSICLFSCIPTTEFWSSSKSSYRASESSFEREDILCNANDCEERKRLCASVPLVGVNMNQQKLFEPFLKSSRRGFVHLYRCSIISNCARRKKLDFKSSVSGVKNIWMRSRRYGWIWLAHNGFVSPHCWYVYKFIELQ